MPCAWQALTVSSTPLADLCSLKALSIDLESCTALLTDGCLCEQVWAGILDSIDASERFDSLAKCLTYRAIKRGKEVFVTVPSCSLFPLFK